MSVVSAEDCVERARAAQTAWARMKGNARKSAMVSLRMQIAADRELLVNAIVADTGKPALDALAGDVLVTLEQMRFYERRHASMLTQHRVGRSALFYPRCRFVEYFEPYGTVLVFGPANYPLQLALVPAITALYAGNAVVIKVSEKTPSVAHVIEEVIHKSALPADVVQVVCTRPEEAGNLIAAKPDFVFFTGSSEHGRTVAAHAASKGIPALLELGGSDAAVVFADCELARTVEGIVYGAFSNAGQVCVGIKRLFVEQSFCNSLLASLVHRTAALRVGSGHDGDMGRLPTAAALSRFEAQVQDALDRGAKLETAAAITEGRAVILTNVPPEARLLREEPFGPVLCVQPFASEADAVTLANASSFALGASVWTRDIKRAHRIAKALNAGSCSINDVIRNIANPHAAFGGNADSGYGRYHGEHGLRAFSRIKTVMENRSSRKREMNWFPFTRKQYDGLDSLIQFRHGPFGLMAALRRAMHLAMLGVMLAFSLTMMAQSTDLLIHVRLPANAHGQVAYLVFNSPDGFPNSNTKAVAHGFSKPVGQESVETIDVGKLPPGQYAVSVYLDENGNRKLDSKLFGIPKEPVGVSNNPPRRMGPPRFQDCVFTVGPTAQTISILLVRP